MSAQPDNNLRLALLRAAQYALRRVEETAPAEPPPPEVTLSERWEVEIRVTARRPARSPPATAGQPGGAAEGPSGDIPDDIRRVLRDARKPLKVGAIAKECGRDPPSSWFREVLRRLVACGEVLRREGDYYWPAGRPLPG